GIGSSLIHEVGHQGAALLELVPSLRARLRAEQASATAADRVAWLAYDRWISEIVADLWSVGTLGVGSTLGLIGGVSLPPWFVFRVASGDPHPVPWLRVRLSCAMGRELYPDPRWDDLDALWCRLYPTDNRLAASIADLLHAAQRSMPAFVRLLC